MKRESLIAYRDKLEKSICDYCHKYSADERSAGAIESMLECLDVVENHIPHALTYEEAVEWVNSMQNDDGTVGQHWSETDTTAVANENSVNFGHISPSEWWVTMNMMYSDYRNVAVKFGIDSPTFYACLAKAFLFDKDGKDPSEKLSEYYHNIRK